MTEQRTHWRSRFGFILAAAGSAIGLGNIWKFPYITGENGGGWFVLIYLACILLVGLPIMMAEVLIGRTAQTSPVGAFRKLSRPGSPWLGVGWLGVAAAFVVLSYYSVVAGWSMHYAYLSVSNAFAGQDADGIKGMFGSLYTNAGQNLFWHVTFMVLTIAIVIGGVQKGVERWARILMPMLFIMLLVLFFRAITSGGFGRAVDFVFGLHSDKLTSAGVLEALGHAFFTLSLGMGAMITYGSYLRRNEDIVKTSVIITVLDTGIALMACLVLFPITFAFNMEPEKTVGLVFQNIPVAMSQMPGGAIWSSVFFVLLTFAALTSAMSLLEVAVSYFIDERRWSRPLATLVTGGAILLLGIPSALSGGQGMFGAQFAEATNNLVSSNSMGPSQSAALPFMHILQGFAGKNWFDTLDHLASNWMLPLGGLGIAMFVAWRVGGQARAAGFMAGTRYAKLYFAWLFLLRYLVPLGVIAVFLHAIGLL